MENSFAVTSLAASLESGSIAEAKGLLLNQRLAVRKIPKLVEASGVGRRDFSIDPGTGHLIAYYTTESQRAALVAAGSHRNVWIRYDSEDLRKIRESLETSTLFRDNQLGCRVSIGFDPNAVLIEGTHETIKAIEPLSQIPGVELLIVDKVKIFSPGSELSRPSGSRQRLPEVP